MRGRLTLILLLALLLNGLALTSSSSLRLLGGRVERVEDFLSSLQGATLELSE